ncbi:MAG TPA: class I SAM-dependent methyltransferase [Thermoanaerobaculia bacterium]|nr:class I SAM-dependent methyltransferase [Thermoanaerobaculia bacterium]
MLQPAQFWDREVTAPVNPPSHSWMAHPDVRHYINRSIGGQEADWPMDWFQRRYPGQTFANVLSIGCGSGALERDLVRRGIATSVEAFDASPASIDLARKLAADEGFSGAIHYSIADFNAVTLERSRFDLICFHQSLHHVEALEHLLLQVRRALKPGGMLYLDEFVGPSRTFWNEYTVRWYRAFYQTFPRSVRYFDQLAIPIQKEDPSEAIRSSEILSRLLIGFSIEEFRGYGGNIMAVLFPNCVVEQLTDEQVRTMIAAEESMIGAGAPHFHAVIVARPKSGTASVLADLRYRIEHSFPSVTVPLRSLLRRLRGRPESSW